MKKSKFFFLLLMLGCYGCSSVEVVEETGVKPPQFVFKKAFKNTNSSWSREIASPYVTTDYIFQASSYGFLSSMNHNGRELWRFKVSAGVEGRPYYSDGRVYVGANDGHFYCLEAKKGGVLWKYKTQDPILSQPEVSGGLVYVLTTGDYLYALDAISGQWRWHYKRDKIGDQITVRGSAAPSYFEGRIYVGFSDGYCVSLNAKNGAVIWSKKVSEGERFIDVDSTPYVDQKRVIVLGFEGDLYCLERGSGNTLWKVTTKGGHGFYVDQSSVFVSTSSGEVYAFHLGNGKTAWKAHIENGTLTAPVVLGSAVCVGDNLGALHGLDRSSGKEAWRYKVKYGFSAAPVAFNGRLYAYSNTAKLVVLKN